MLSRALKMAFWVYYDHFGKLVLANLLWAALLALPALAALAAFMTGDPSAILVVAVPSILLAAGVIVPVFGAGLAFMVKELIDTSDATLRDLFRGIRLYWRRAAAVGIAYLVAETLLAVSVWFYAARLGANLPWLGYGISGLAVWCLALLFLTQTVVLPALVQKKAGARATLKLAALLVLDNPRFCLGLLVYFALIGAFSIKILPIAAFFSGSLAVVLSSTAYEMLARKYAALERQKAGEPADAPGRAGAVTVRNGRLAFDDSRDDYLNRGFRDFWFPWKA